ncbi:MAG: NAD(P)H-hydrate dehydratase [bacterium]|nr:NAD(P)H-hydrate dehydratase [bacterium]
MKLSTIYKKRPRDARKGDFGKLLVIGGSFRYTGAPIFNAIAALRTGCDLVTIAAPERAADISASFLPDLMTYPLSGTHLIPAHIPTILELSAWASAIVLGGGLGQSEETKDAVATLARAIKKPLVVDADGLTLLVPSNYSFEDQRVIFTPHAGELGHLLGEEVPDEQHLSARKEMVKKAASAWNVTILLKGYRDIVSDGSRIVVDQNDSPFLTKGGIGDILAGVCGGFLARGITPFDAACAAAVIVGQAGKHAAKTFGESLLASDVLDALVDVVPQ